MESLDTIGSGSIYSPPRPNGRASRLKEKRQRRLEEVNEHQTELRDQYRTEDEAIAETLVAKDQGLTPQTCKRGCTDFVFVLIMLAFVGLEAIDVVKHLFFDWGSFTVLPLPNVNGTYCGTEDQASKHLLFWCRSPLNHSRLEEHMPICVRECPHDDNQTMDCRGQFLAPNENATQTSYRSRVYEEILCLPYDADMHAQVYGFVGRNRLMRVSITITNINQDTLMTVLIYCCTLALCMNFIGFMRKYADKALLTTLICIGTVAAIAGARFTYLYKHPAPYDPTLLQRDSPDEYLMLGCISWTIASIVLMHVVCQRSHLTRTSQCLKVACDLVFEEQALIGNIFVRLVTRAALFNNFFHYAAANMSRTGMRTVEAGRKTPEVSLLQVAAILYRGLILLWLDAAFSGLCNFASSYLTQIYYFVDEGQYGDDDGDADDFATQNHTLFESLRLLTSTYCVGLRYHAGSFCIGGLIVIVARPLHLVIGPTYYVSVSNDDNPVGHTLRLLCCWVFSCYSKLVPFERGAYMDMAMNGGTFCASAYASNDIMMEDSVTNSLLKGAVRLFQLAVFGSVICMSYSTTFILLELEDSQNGAETPTGRTNIIGFNIFYGVMVASPFMAIFDMVSHNIQYCILIKRRRERLQNDRGGFGVGDAFESLLQPVSSLICTGDRKAGISGNAHGTNA